MSDKIKIAHLNANGVERSLDVIINYCTEQNIDILLLTETFLLSGKLNTSWTQYHNYAWTSGNAWVGFGGLTLLICPDFPYHVHIHLYPNRYTITCTIGSYTIHSLYLPPSLTLNQYTETLTNLTIDNSTIFLGDLNTRLGSQLGDQCDNNRAPIFHNWILDHGLILWNETLAYGISTFYKPTIGSSIIDFFISTETAV